jgi:hypothetical protein
MNISILPEEIQLHIISFIPMCKLITDNPPPIINEYILYYIENELLKDNYIAGCLYASNIYYKNVLLKVNDLPFPDIKFSLSNYLINRDQCTGFYLDTTYGINYNEKSIRENIYRILFKNMHCSDTTIDIKSIQMIKHQLNTKTLIKIPKFI